MATLNMGGLAVTAIAAFAGYKLAKSRTVPVSPAIGLVAGGLLGLVAAQGLPGIRAQSQLDECDPAFWQERARPGVGAYQEQLSPIPYSPDYWRPAHYGGSQTMLGAYDPAQQFGWQASQRMGAVSASGPRASMNANVYRNEESFQQVRGTRMTVVAT